MGHVGIAAILLPKFLFRGSVLLMKTKDYLPVTPMVEKQMSKSGMEGKTT